MEKLQPASGTLTLGDIKQLYRDATPERAENIEDYADELRYEIGERKARLRQIRARRSTFAGRLIRLIRWASQPRKRNQARTIPGIGLELTLIGLHVVIGIGHLVLVFRG